LQSQIGIGALKRCSSEFKHSGKPWHSDVDSREVWLSKDFDYATRAYSRWLAYSERLSVLVCNLARGGPAWNSVMGS
jgi:hypothetical protein